MNPLNLEKSIREHLASIRKVANTLPKGQKLAILNKCDKIAVLSKKATAQMLTPFHKRGQVNPTSQADMAALADQNKRIWNALLAGRTLDLTDGPEFRTSQMHTHFFRIRRKIEKEGHPYVLKSIWYRPQEGMRGYKRYWLEPIKK